MKRLEKLWNEHPDLRFGQFLINLAIVEDTYPVWSNEDDGLEEYLKNFKW